MVKPVREVKYTFKVELICIADNCDWRDHVDIMPFVGEHTRWCAGNGACRRQSANSIDLLSSRLQRSMIDISV